ncbi:peptidyl-tRNA hydrolase domain-containing protein [Xylona heveae TC161]|uniref:Peptidyl-tRNA hydrolase domain-containing protein n=1 Tax=Xylona heveae (strain CBS 132557 / TC161) TaxID=1328760 RepID=A0A165G9S8_XYLHT|nr:peptidyl-tRNA hydrolase domain-containing protein [Xylona heveae TC161]KZF21918.1 peptidyl-tRNA hydrolase domain-containing protein [Xylona heveae TC161]
MMLRHLAGARSLLPKIHRNSFVGSLTCRRLASNTNRSGSLDEAELAAARRWIANCTPDSIPKNLGQVSFSRSSGPGGQNVNKVNSKATLRLSLDALYNWVPRPLRASIKDSRYYAPNSNSLIIQADDTRSQAKNANQCFGRLHELILQAARNTIPGETSDEQRERVKGLKQAEKEAKMRMKKGRSDKKSARRNKGSDY